jgi:hypothetical protein
VDGVSFLPAGFFIAVLFLSLSMLGEESGVCFGWADFNRELAND